MHTNRSNYLLATLGFFCVWITGLAGQTQQPTTPAIPRTWDDAEIARHEIPLADTAGSPKHVSADYYYKIPVRPIYKGYPVYAPGHEPTETEGPYTGPYVYQQYHPLADFKGNHPVIGSWMINGYAAGIGIREDVSPVTGNFSRFIPHVFSNS